MVQPRSVLLMRMQITPDVLASHPSNKLVFLDDAASSKSLLPFVHKVCFCGFFSYWMLQHLAWGMLLHAF